MAGPFSIEEYWRPTFRNVKRVASQAFPDGWSSPEEVSPWFVEPDLAIRADCGSATAPIVLIAAPGAVGKSTLAKSLCARSGLVFVDLAKSDTVGGNFLTGGLMRAGSQVLAACTERSLGLAIDALDEARFRVTPQSFTDFLKDVIAVMPHTSTPIVLFGRTGIADECWRWFKQTGIEAAVFDIELFDESRAVRFVENDLRRRAKRHGDTLAGAVDIGHVEKFAEPYRKAALGFVKQLADASRGHVQVEALEQREAPLSFAGYAPVLEAIGAMLAETRNPSTLASGELEARAQDVLFNVVDRILEREQDKVREGLALTFGSALPAGLYGPQEQRRRLVARLFEVAPPPTPPQVPQSLQQAYEDAVVSFLGQHPFLDGTGSDVSSAVFSADLIAFALHSGETGMCRAGEEWAERSTSAPNPFLVDFYAKRTPDGAAQELGFVTPEHVGLLDASMRARLRAGQQATLEFLQEEGGDAAAFLEIVRTRDGVEEVVERRDFRSSAAGTLRLTRKVSRATVLADDLDIELGDGQTSELSAPILFDVCKLRFRAKDIMISKETTTGSPDSGVDDYVVLLAKAADASSVQKPPRVADGMVLLVGWPGATAHPWNRFAVSPPPPGDPSLAEAQRSLRRLVLSFRSHSKGQLARFKDKIEHRRMTKGEIGERIRNALLADRVLSVQGVYYILDPDVLGRQLDTDYASLRDKIFSERANTYLTKLLGE
jgi:hypothetical protein